MPKNIPIIDVTTLMTESQSSGEVGRHLHEALMSVGFAYIKGHQIPEKLALELKTFAGKFFSLDEEKKMHIAMKKRGRAWRGYFPIGEELTAKVRDRKEGLYFGTEHANEHLGVQNNWPMHGQNIWPKEPEFAGFPDVVHEFTNKMRDLGQKLLSALALGLGIERDYFHKRFTHDPTILFRIFNYPVDQHSWGVNEHTDMGFLTMLMTDGQAGLQVKTADNHWIEAPPIDDYLIVNIGDMLQFWTHGVYRATLHRVRSPEKKNRLSFPVFFDPNWQAKLQQIPREKLRSTDLEKAGMRPDRPRWDGLEWQKITADSTYGDFVWEKIKHVFPNLANGNPHRVNSEGS